MLQVSIRLPATLFIPSLVLLLAGCGDADRSSPNSPLSSELEKAVAVYEIYDGITKPVDGPPTITLSMYEQTDEGMTYAQVVKIIGAEADLSTEDSVGPTGANRQVAQWINGDATSATLTFLNARLVTKKQQGLH